MSNLWRLMALTAVLLPCTGLAQNGFRVSPETGLEQVGETPAAPAKAASKAAASASDTKEPTEITASKETRFDEKMRVAIFLGDVTVKDPQFNLTCDKLTAYLKKTPPESGKKGAVEPVASAKAVASPTPTAPAGKGAKAPEKAESGPGSGLDRAVAEGNVVITQDKVDASNGEVTHYVGKGAKADYNAVSGDMTLTGWPQIQQGVNNQVATDEGTIMIMNRDGHLKTIGPSKTEIQQQSDDAPKGDKAKPGQPEAKKTP